ncbi:hypothetical protein BSKO_08185 [Bryopsis sp. KO-2023]|nr:hypothetical protein BSKO_08185 [Bryopsis sp. KO-2023]
MPNAGRSYRMKSPLERRYAASSIDGSSTGRESYHHDLFDGVFEEICQVETVTVSKRYMMPTISSLVKQRRAKRRPSFSECVAGENSEPCGFNRHHTQNTARQNKKQRKTPSDAEVTSKKEFKPDQRSVGVQTSDSLRKVPRVKEKTPPINDAVGDIDSISLKEGVVDITRRIELCSVRNWRESGEVVDSRHGVRPRIARWSGVLSFMAGATLALGLKMMHD